MKRVSLLSLFALLMAWPGPTFGSKATFQARKQVTSVTGTYSVKWKRGALCVLGVQQLPDDKIKFELDCNRGAPSYNSGTASGTIAIKDHVAVYSTTEFNGKCEIKFQFQKSKVIVSQTGGDFECGFGHGVTCDGSYTLTSRKPPKFGENK